MVNDVFPRDYFRRNGISTEEYVENRIPGEHKATLDMKTEGRNGRQRLFFTFDDGRKIIAPVYYWKRYLGFYEIPVGSKVVLTYIEKSDGVFLTDAKVIGNQENGKELI